MSSEQQVEPVYTYVNFNGWGVSVAHEEISGFKQTSWGLYFRFQHQKGSDGLGLAAVELWEHDAWKPLVVADDPAYRILQEHRTGTCPCPWHLIEKQNAEA